MCNRFTRHLCAVVLVCLPVSAAAEVLVLIQGYLGGADSWRESGIVTELGRDGWRDGGHLSHGPQGVVPSRRAVASGTVLYTLELPSDAPMAIQLRHFTPYIDFIRRRHEGESLLLVGHSAGGVLGRYYMVENPEAGVSTLITFASPHLGTEAAEAGVMAGQSPLGWLGPMLGLDVLNRSQGLYRDLAREYPGGLLFWLNRQPHPGASYISVVRADDGWLGDVVVPAWSQDLNNVHALRGRARSIPSNGGHGLDRSDGQLLVRILRQLRSA